MPVRPVPVTLLLVIVPDTPVNAVVSPVFISPPVVNSKSHVSDVPPPVMSNVPICSAAIDAAINIDCRYRKKKQLKIWLNKYDFVDLANLPFWIIPARLRDRA
jgi:hypothetical protein